MSVWQDKALCAEVDPDLFFPVCDDARSAANAKKICAACPVRNECLTYALVRGERYGVWGGMSGQERRELRAQLFQRAAA
ncbi:WhiB family transcriptional regulator [Nonomuraea dietziae]|uniref:WhiB family transcriptional regulator n=1 Tax=Nonomuraea dietziae TaxID=65515 RepID=UPI0034494C0F